MTATVAETSLATLPALGRELIAKPIASTQHVIVPTTDMLQLPERAIQFGTGGFLRAFVDAFIDTSNHAGEFNGRVVVIASTESGRNGALSAQNGLFTLIEAGETDVAPPRVIGAISRALSASHEWDTVLDVARDTAITIIISNTTEAGFALNSADQLPDETPRSFPAKIARFLIERANFVACEPLHRMIVLPCELIEDNGNALRALVLTQAEQWNTVENVMEWMRTSVAFCNTLVDRIVPGIPEQRVRSAWSERLGYTDALLTIAEPFALFAIEGAPELADQLGFVRSNPAIRIVPSVRPYRERKVTLLNGAHSAIAALGVLASLSTVLEVMQQSSFAQWTRNLLHQDLVPMLDVPEASEFADATVARFANPSMHHLLSDILVQGTLKMRVRLLPVIRRYGERSLAIPDRLLLALAAQLVVHHPEQHERLLASGTRNFADDLAPRVVQYWHDAHGAVSNELDTAIFSDVALWQADLTEQVGLVSGVADALRMLLTDGALQAIQKTSKPALIWQGD